jgi:hypothetical protein
MVMKGEEIGNEEEDDDEGMEDELEEVVKV